MRAQLSFVLEGVISQTLLPRASGSGRVMATTQQKLVIPDVDVVRTDDLVAALHEDGMVRSAEYELRRRDGQIITVVENARVLRSADGATHVKIVAVALIAGMMVSQYLNNHWVNDSLAAAQRQQNVRYTSVETKASVRGMQVGLRDLRLATTAEQVKAAIISGAGAGKRKWVVVQAPDGGKMARAHAAQPCAAAEVPL